MTTPAGGSHDTFAKGLPDAKVESRLSKNPWGTNIIPSAPEGTEPPGAVLALDKLVTEKLQAKNAAHRVDVDTTAHAYSVHEQKIALPADFQDRPVGVNLLLARLISLMKIGCSESAEKFTLTDAESEMDFCVGMMFGLEESTLTRKNFKWDSEFDKGRSVILHERRLAKLLSLGFSAERLWTPDKIHPPKGKKLFTTGLLRFTGCDKIVASRIHDLIERLVKQFVRTGAVHIKHDLEDLVNDFNAEWGSLAPTRVVVSETKKKGKTVSTTSKQKYHPKRPSAMVGILDTESSMMKNIFDRDWDYVKHFAEKNKQYVQALNQDGETETFRRLNDIVSRQIKVYDLVRRTAYKRITYLMGAKIPAKQSFAEALEKYFTKVKAGEEKMQSFFYPHEFLDFSKVSWKSQDGFAFVGAASIASLTNGNYDGIPGVQDAWKAIDNITRAAKAATGGDNTA